MIRKLLSIAIVSSILAYGCASTTGAVKSDEVVTTTSGNVMIEPPLDGQNHVLVKITNPTSQGGLDLSEAVKSGLVQKGYQLVEYPDQANYTVMGNIVQAGETEPQLLKQAYRSRYGSRLSLRDPSGNLLAKAVGSLVDRASAKSYILILDLKIQSRQEAKGKATRYSSKTRIVSGIQSSRTTLERTMPAIRDRVAHTVVSMF